MSGYVSGPERRMRETIDWLLDLPEEERQLMEQAVHYNFTEEAPAPRTPAPERPIQDPFVGTLNMGTTEATALLLEQSLRPAVLSFAHGHNCGGGFEHAGGSQEEYIWRTSSLFLSLWPHRREDDGPGVLARGQWIGDYDDKLPRREPFYPYARCAGTYSPHVRLVREEARHNAPLHSPEAVTELPIFGALTVAAPDLSRESQTYTRNLLVEKVRTALYMAVLHGHDSVVLGAFGCGYFGNDPEVVAGVFAELLLDRGEFAGHFRALVFGIPDRAGANLRAFVKHFPMVAPSAVAVPAR